MVDEVLARAAARAERASDEAVAAAGADGSTASASSAFELAATGDVIPVSDPSSLLKGHGTRARGESLIASVVGRVERVNRLVAVRALRSRYVAQVGDVVVARVRELTGARWRLDAGARHDVSLPVAAAALPGAGGQRRVGAEDELAMRAALVEGDLVSAEVHAVHADGGAALTARGARYGRLAEGALVVVPSALVRKTRRQARAVEVAVGGAKPDVRSASNSTASEPQGASSTVTLDLVIGANGWIWAGPHRDLPAAPQDATPGSDPGPFALRDGRPLGGPAVPPPRETRLAVAAVLQGARALAALGAPVDPDALVQAVQVAVDAGVAPQDMGREGYLRTLAEEVLGKEKSDD